MAEKFAIYAGEPMASVLAGYDTERSARINQVCAEWRDLIQAAAPDTLTEAQWCAIVDACNGTMIDDEHTWRMMWAELACAPETCEKWGIDQAATVETLRAMTWPQLLAIRETVRGYWVAVAGADPTSHRAALEAAGAKIKP
jgi:hypothetical protein